MQGLLVNDIYRSFQGEGHLAGTPMVILRLQGCEVGCPWCDTKYTWTTFDAQRVNTLNEAVEGKDNSFIAASIETIVSYIEERYRYLKWVLVTGGEPADQQLDTLVSALHAACKLAAIETSGTALGHIGAGFDWVTVSPKIDMPGGRKVAELAINTADEIKMVIASRKDVAKLDDLLGHASLKASAVISLQPVSMSKKATQICIEEALDRGWNVSLQMHKYLELK